MNIHALNEVNRLAYLEVQNILPQLDKYLGKKILTLNGLAKSFNIDLLKQKPKSFNDEYSELQYCILTNEHNFLVLKISICLKFNDSTVFYERRSIILAKTKNFNLISIYDFEKKNFPKYDLTEQISLLKEYKEINERIIELKYKIVLPL